MSRISPTLLNLETLESRETPTVFQGTTTIRFDDVIKTATSVVNGENTSELRWGSATANRLGGQSVFAGKSSSFKTNDNQSFVLGTFDYKNFETRKGTSIKGTDLEIKVDFAGTTFVDTNVSSQLKLSTTTNTASVYRSRDTVEFVAGATEFKDNKGQTYVLQVVGLTEGNVNATTDNYSVNEGTAAKFKVVGTIFKGTKYDIKLHSDAPKAGGHGVPTVLAINYENTGAAPVGTVKISLYASETKTLTRNNFTTGKLVATIVVPTTGSGTVQFSLANYVGSSRTVSMIAVADASDDLNETNEQNNFVMFEFNNMK